MIFLLVIIFAAATFISWMLIKHAFPRWFFGLLFTVLLLASVALMTLNMSRHFGMSRTLSVRRQEIYSVAGDQLAAGVLATAQSKKLGNDLDIFLYKNQPAAKGTKSSVPAMHRQISLQEISTNRAYRITRTYHWRYNNSVSKMLFGIGHLDRSISSQQVLFQIPVQQWIQLTTRQLTRLQTLLANPEKITNPEILMLLSSSSQALQAGHRDQAAQTQVTAIRELLSITPSAADRKLKKQLSSSSSAAASKSQSAASSIAAAQAASVSASAASEAAAQAASASQSQAEQQAAADAAAAASSSSAMSSSSASSAASASR